MDIEKYLKVIEAEKNRPEEKHIVHIKSLDEDMEIRTLTHSERRDLIYSQRIKKVTIGDMLTPEMIKTIYSCMDLKKIAVPAKEKGLIQSYYDIIEYLFKPDDIADIILKIYEINGMSTLKKDDDPVDELKN